ncbi:MAG: cell wall hydrolase [Lachnospiraceae bacterium]|nr:cell wall hydrolase [Lachnospiraceae bacterium]
MRRAGRQRIAACVAMAVLLCAVPTTAYADVKDTEKKLNEAKEEKKKTEDALNSTREELDDLEETTEGLKGQLNSLNNSLAEVSDNLAELEKRIEEKQAQIEQTGRELEEAKRVEQEQYAAMKKRIQFMYEKRDYILLEMLFGSASFSELLNRNDYIEQLSAYDREQLTLYQEIRAGIEETEARLIGEKEELDELRIEVEAEQSRFAGLVGQTSGKLSNYQHLMSEAEQEMLAYEQKLAEQNNNIAELQKQLEEERRLSLLAAQSAWRDISEISFAEGDRYLLANLIYCEAGNQPFEGQVAVGAVVMNRVMSSVFPDTVVGVIYQNKQFSPVASGRLALALAENYATPACYQAADQAMKGATTVGNCLFFRTPIEGLSGKQIGGHIFY